MKVLNSAKKFCKEFLIFLFFYIWCSVILVNFFVEALEVSADAAILMCADTGEVLFAKNENKPHAMASTTKIMTSIIALEYIDACGDKDIEINDEMANVEGCALGLKSGDVVTLKTLVKGALLPSGNDAATSIAYAISGSKESFADVMNEKANLIGMKNTHFVTPSGLDEGDHHSSAYDMALLAIYCMENSDFRDIVSKKSMQIEFKNPKKTVTVRNHNKLLRLYKNCIGIKTGFTKKSGRCLVSCAEDNGIRLVCVTLDAPSDWDDHINMFNFGFSNVEKRFFDDAGKTFAVSVRNAENGVDNVKLVCENNFSLTKKLLDTEEPERVVELPAEVSAPIEKGQILGKITYKFKGKTVGQNVIVSTQDVKAAKSKGHFFKNFWLKIKSVFS